VAHLRHAASQTKKSGAFIHLWTLPKKPMGRVIYIPLLNPISRSCPQYLSGNKATGGWLVAGLIIH